MAETLKTQVMSITRTKAEYQKDTYDERLLLLSKYNSRCKLVMAGAAGLLFLTGTDLICNTAKIIDVSVVFFIVWIAGTALLRFEDDATDIQYKITHKGLNGSHIASTFEWPSKDEGKYHLAAILTFLLAVFLMICMFFKKTPPPVKDPGKTYKTYNTSSVSFTIGPFVEGFDTLQPDSVDYKLSQLKDSLTRPFRTYTEMDIYGGVDCRQLRRESKKKFGDNITLAQSRAEWVKDKIESFNCTNKSCRLFASVVGARKYAYEYTAEDYAMSRYVIINCRYVDSMVVKL